MTEGKICAFFDAFVEGHVFGCATRLVWLQEVHAFTLLSTHQTSKEPSEWLVPCTGLIRFQSTWREIAEGMGLVSKRVRSSDPDYAAKVRERTLVDSLPELRTAAQRLESLITDTRQCTGAVSLDISHGSMASRTAEGFYKTLINGADYIV